jgi:molybdopterin-biosynthesis enzyme MoeA-like protein
MIMFMLRGCKYLPNPTNKPDGMMVRADGWWTDKKESAKLFGTPQEAEDFHTNFCLPLWHNNPSATQPVYIVEVETKPVADKISKIITKQLM